MHLKTVAKYIRRSPYQAIAAIMIMALTFFVVSLFSFLTVFSVRFINYFESRPQLTVFFKDGTDAASIDAFKTQLESTGKVASLHYVSKEDALKIYKEQNKSDPILLDLVTADILPASFDIQANQAQDLFSLSNIAQKSPIVDKVIFQKDVVDTLISWVTAVKQIGLVVIGILLLVSIFVIITIIGIRVTLRRDEIEIMRLIGATNWFIRAPFILEGMFYGFTGSLVGFVLSIGLMLYAGPFMGSFFKGLPIYPITPTLVLEILGGEVLFASLLGGFASFLAVLRYLE